MCIENGKQLYGVVCYRVRHVYNQFGYVWNVCVFVRWWFFNRIFVILYIFSHHLRTCNCCICEHNSINSRVPCTLMLTAKRSFSSKRTVAAAWKTTFAFDISVCRSTIFKPKPAREQSPKIATILCRNFGTVSRSLQNTWSSKISSRRVWMSRPFFGRTSI